MDKSDVKANVGALEAVLFAAGEPIAISSLAKILAIDELEVNNLLTELSTLLASYNSGLQINHVAGGYQLSTKSEFFPAVEKLNQVVDRKLSAPTMETLSIIAFKQPITKSEIEFIRGVRAERALQKLLELELIAEVGRKAVLGRPILYGTTPAFLACFGINSLDDLPKLPSDEEAMSGQDKTQFNLFADTNISE